MKVNYEDISKYGLEFKHIISGPAPVGRILNYIKLTGNGSLKHKNGSRDLLLNDNIGSAWTTEFMVGLGLVYYDQTSGSDVYPLYLTPKGKEIFDLIKESPVFDEKSNINDCKKQLLEFSPVAYKKLEKVFKASVICKNLCKYIINEGKNTFKKRDFLNDYFGHMQKYYTGEDYIYSVDGGATTGENRMPSLIQLCQFFDCVVYDAKTGYYTFDYDKLNEDNIDVQFIPVDSAVQKKLNDENLTNEKIISDLVDKYGIDGTVAREIVTRNSSVQDLFRNNLIARYGCKCALCNKDIDTVLVASHIKPASQCNVLDKANCENGLLLCALHDKLFDRYLISFDAITGELLYSKQLNGKLAEYQLEEGMKLDDKYMTAERKDYLLEHNLAFYEKNK